MTKRLLISLCLIAGLGFVWFLWSIQSKDISVELQGMKYRLGENNKDFVQPIKVRIKGSLHHSITGNRSFTGTIELGGEMNPTPTEQRELNIALPKDEPGLMIYSYFENGEAKFHHVGGLFVNSDFTKVAFYLYERTNEGSQGAGWGGDNGLMLSAPASNRTEALAVSKQLMKHWIFAPFSE